MVKIDTSIRPSGVGKLFDDKLSGMRSRRVMIIRAEGGEGRKKEGEGALIACHAIHYTSYRHHHHHLIPANLPTYYEQTFYSRPFLHPKPATTD